MCDAQKQVDNAGKIYALISAATFFCLSPVPNFNNGDPYPNRILLIDGDDISDSQSDKCCDRF